MADIYFLLLPVLKILYLGDPKKSQTSAQNQFMQLFSKLTIGKQLVAQPMEGKELFVVQEIWQSLESVKKEKLFIVHQPIILAGLRCLVCHLIMMNF